MTVQDDILYIKIIIGPLGTINDRTTLNGHPSTVGNHFFIGFHHTGLHVEMHLYHIPFLPLPVYPEIAFTKFTGHLLAIHQYTIAQLQVVGIRIKVTRKYTAAHPTRNTDIHRKRQVALSHLHTNISVPGVSGFLLQHHFLFIQLQLGTVGQEKVDVHLIVFHGIHISRQRRNEPADVAGTAGTTKPRLTCNRMVGIKVILTIARQRIGIEELTSVQ